MKCPNCGNIIHDTEPVDSEWCDNRCYDTVEGTCPNCGKRWMWTEVYTFAHIIDVQEIESDDHL